MKVSGMWIFFLLLAASFASAADSRPVAKPALAPQIRMHLVPVESSLVRAIAYNKHRKILDVLFLRGKRYRYFAVPATTAKAFFAAASKGKFYNDRIKRHFRCERLR
jgi:hypothetical protein